MNRQKKVEELRGLLQSKFGAGQGLALSKREDPFPEASTSSMVEFQPGKVFEIIAPMPSAGVACLTERILRAQDQGPLALIDGRGAFTFEDVLVSRLLWLRCHRVNDAIKAADWLLRDGNIPFVILDLHLNSVAETRRISPSSWHRLRAVTRESAVVFLAFMPEKAISCADVRFCLKDRLFSLADLDRERDEIALGLVPERNRSGSVHSSGAPLAIAG